ncbi:MAG: GNAT family N-acetyltransferase [Planctomycetota bacterium]
MEVTIRPYRKKDRSDVLDIAEESFEGVCLEHVMEQDFGCIGGASWRERKKKGIDYDLKRRSRDALVADIGGHVVGFVCTRLYHKRSIGHVANLAVASRYQGRGIGRALVDAAVRHLRDRGMEYARVETLEHNERAGNLYESAGFEEIARRVYYFREL